MKLFRELYNYREMIYSLVRRDLRGRYKGSILGFLWTFLNPLLQLAVYTFVFSVILDSNIEKYYLFLFVGLVPWIFFSTSLTGGSACIWTQKEMVKKIYFPREVLPIAYVTSQFINMLLSMVIIFIVVIIFGNGLNPESLLFLPIVMLVEYILALGITMLTSAATVYIRDLQYILGIITMAWQFMSPVMYSVDRIPENLLRFYYLNPMTSVIIAYRDILFYKKNPDISTLLIAIISGIVFLVIGTFSFRHLQKHFAEEL